MPSESVWLSLEIIKKGEHPSNNSRRATSLLLREKHLCIFLKQTDKYLCIKSKQSLSKFQKVVRIIKMHLILVSCILHREGNSRMHCMKINIFIYQTLHIQVNIYVCLCVCFDILRVLHAVLQTIHICIYLLHLSINKLYIKISHSKTVVYKTFIFLFLL